MAPLTRKRQVLRALGEAAGRFLATILFYVLVFVVLPPYVLLRLVDRALGSPVTRLLKAMAGRRRA